MTWKARYIRRSDRLPTYADLGDKSFDSIIARVRLFNPTGAGTWWVAAYDPDTMVAWVAAEIHEREVGSFSVCELVEYRGRRVNLAQVRKLPFAHS